MGIGVAARRLSPRGLALFLPGASLAITASGEVIDRARSGSPGGSSTAAVVRANDENTAFTAFAGF